MSFNFEKNLIIPFFFITIIIFRVITAIVTIYFGFLFVRVLYKKSLRYLYYISNFLFAVSRTFFFSLCSFGIAKYYTLLYLKLFSQDVDIS